MSGPSRPSGPPPGQPSTPEQHHRYTSLSSLIGPNAQSQSPKSARSGKTHSSSPIATTSPAAKKKKSKPKLRIEAEDGTTAANTRRQSMSRPSNGERVHPGPGRKDKDKTKERLGLWKMLSLTVAMGGSQIAWTVELGYGTPYLLSLGLSEQLTSLVWLAGPISGLIAQPLIGAISDSSHSRYRRRYWIVTATIFLVLSGLGLAFTEPIARALVSVFEGGQGDWDPRTRQLANQTAVGIAVLSFYCLDFALNALQASLRNLVLDQTPGEQLATANAWLGRFAHIGNIVGFTMGFLNLAQVPVIRLVGGGQFRKLCLVALVILVGTVWVTCWTQKEDERETLFERKGKISDIFHTMFDAVRHLPKPVRRVCIVQIAAFMGWFPYLFYSTTYVAEVMAHELGKEPDIDKATRAGSLALLIYSFVAIAAGTVLPYLAARDRRLLRPTTEKSRASHPGSEDSEDEEDVELEQIREMVRQWKAEAARHGRPLKLPTMPFMLRNIWTAGLILFAVLMFTTFFIKTVWQATIMLALVGICWAIALWVPFAIIMEFLKEMESSPAPASASSRPPPHTADRALTMPSGAAGFRPLHSRAVSAPWRPRSTSPAALGRGADERAPLMRSYSTADVENAAESMEYTGSGPVAGGTIMGIHNVAIVFPQFIVAIVASLIFRWADGDQAVHPTGHTSASERTGVAWVLRFGGLMALIGAAICRKVPPTKTEKAMRRRLADMREMGDE